MQIFAVLQETCTVPEILMSKMGQNLHAYMEGFAEPAEYKIAVGPRPFSNQT